MPPKSNLSTIIRGIQGTPLVITDQGEAKVFLSNATSSGLATEATLLSILNNMIASQDIEILLVRDTGNNDLVVQQIREYDQGTGAWTTRYEKIDGTPYVAPELVGPLEYLDPSAVLNLVLAELIDQGLTLDSSLVELQAINTNTDQLETLLTTIDTVLDNSLVQLQAINVNTDQLEALSTDIKNLLTTIDADTSNIATDIAAIEVLITTTNALLTTIDGVLDQIQTNTLNTVNELTSANVTLAAVQNELIALNNTASTLATEATLELVRLQLVALNATDFATETTLASLNAKLNTLGQKASAASAPVVLSTEQEAILAAIQTAVQNIDADLGTGGLALETTQQAIETLITSTNALLTTIDADTSNLDVLLSTRASEATLLATNVLLTTIDGVLDAIKVDTGALVVDLAAIEVLITNTNALLTTIDGVLDAIKLDTANLDVALSTRASELTLSGIKTQTDLLNFIATALEVTVTNSTLPTGAATEITLAAILACLCTDENSVRNLLQSIDVDTGNIATSTANIDTSLTPTTRTHNYAVSNGVGSVPAGSMCGSVLNNGSSAGTWNGNALPAGVSVEWSAVGNRDTYGAIAFDATGTEFIIEYTT